MDFLLIVFLTLLNGVFAMSELALAASRKARLAAMAESGDLGAHAALKLLVQPTQFLSTVQVGITSIGVLNGIVGEAAFSDGVARWLMQWGATEKAAGIGATGLVVTVITFTTIIFGELVPKRIGQLYPEPVARWVSRPMLWLAMAASPFVRLLSGTTAAVLKLLRIDTTVARVVTEEEIAASLDEGRDAGLIEQREHQMVQNVFHLDDRPLTSLMVPRSDVVWLDAAMSVGDCLRRIGRGLGGDLPTPTHSWYPVCVGGLDNVTGSISVAKLISLRDQEDQPISAHVVSAVFVPETLSGLDLLEQFRTGSGRLVFVVDEYGGVQGIMTPRDLLEAITGELQPGSHGSAWAVQREDGSWLLDGLMPVAELRARLGVKEFPAEDRGRYNTLAGLLMAVSGHMPVTAERIECAGWLFEVVDLDGKRIDKVLATEVTAPGRSAD